MAVKLEDGAISRSVTVLCLGTAGLLAAIHLHPLTGFSHPGQATVSAFMQPAQSANPASSQSTSTATSELALDTKLVVNLSDRHVSLYKKNQRIGSYPIAIGQDGWETPTGSFKVLDMVRNPVWVHPITGVSVPAGPKNPLGAAWIGFWTDGDTEIGFHGTNEEELIGQAVSHGCLRMHNADIEALYRQVGTGAVVVVQP